MVKVCSRFESSLCILIWAFVVVYGVHASTSAWQDEKNYCKENYRDAEYCYPFDNKDNDNRVFDGNLVLDGGDNGRTGKMHCGAKISKSNRTEQNGGQKSLSLLDKDQKCSGYPWVDLGDFQGTCVADPDKCDGGLTVSVWIKYNQNEAKDFQKKHNYKYSYILSTGGQRQDSRGFSLLYEQNQVLKLQLRTSTSVFILDLSDMKMSEDDWTNLLFTYSKDTGISFYRNSVPIKRVSKPSQTNKCRNCNRFNSFTVGKPNVGDRNYGKFLMRDLVVYLKRLPQTEVAKMFKEMSQKLNGPTIEASPPKTTDEGEIFEDYIVEKKPVPTIGPEAKVETPVIANEPEVGPVKVNPKPMMLERVDLKKGRCENAIDLIFIVDDSGSIEGNNQREGYFRTVKNFVKEVASKFLLGKDRVRVAIVGSDSDAQVVRQLDEIEYDEQLKEALSDESFPQRKGRTFLGKSLKKVDREMIGKSIRDVSTIVVVISDGYSTDCVAEPSTKLREDHGVVIYGVVFGKDSPLRRQTVQDLVSKPMTEHATEVNYDELMESSESLAQKICKESGRINEGKKNLKDMRKDFPLCQVEAQPEKNWACTVEEINQYRRMHSSIPVQWSHTLARKANQIAQFLASRDRILVFPPKDLTPTVYVGPQSDVHLAATAVNTWYDQIVDHNFTATTPTTISPTISKKNRYLAQLLWRQATEVGVARSNVSSSGRSYVVAMFDAAPDAQSVQCNVFPVNSFASPDTKSLCQEDGVLLEDGYCYKLFTNSRKNWTEAASFCHSKRASLFSVNTNNDFNSASVVMSSAGVKEAWIGLNDRSLTNVYQWEDGSPLTFNGWMNRPLVDNAKRCVLNDHKDGWDKENCQSKLPFICKAIQPRTILGSASIQYQTEPWTQEMASGTSSQVSALVRRVQALISGIYINLKWMESATVTSLRGDSSTYVDVAFRFSEWCPVDPFSPLKEVLYTEDCHGYICNLASLELHPSISPATVPPYQQPSCPNILLDNLPVVTVPVEASFTQANSVYAAPQQQQIQWNGPTVCSPACISSMCSDGCPANCCSTTGIQRRKKRTHIKNAQSKEGKSKNNTISEENNFINNTTTNNNERKNVVETRIVSDVESADAKNEQLLEIVTDVEDTD